MKIKKWKQFENTNYYEYFVDAHADGVIEYGGVIMEIDDNEIYLNIEESTHIESSNNSFRVFLEDLKHKNLLNVKFSDDNEYEIVDKDFVNDVWEYYGYKTREKR